MANGKMTLRFFYKEWLKTRFFVLAVLVLGLAAVAYIFLDVDSSVRQNGPFNYLMSVLYGIPQGNYYIRIIRFLPLIAAVAIGFAQYVPEVLDKRIKLTFHLPMRNSRAIFLMLLYGFCAILMIYLFIFGAFFILNNHYFPWEETRAVLVSVTPWMLGGFAAYFMIALIAMEPRLIYQFLYALVAYFLVVQFYVGHEHGDTVRIIGKLAVLALMPAVGIFFSMQRFIKGER